MQPELTTVQQLLETDPIWAAYALADLQPDFAPVCAWYTGDVERHANGNRADHAVALVFTGLEIPTLFLSGSAAAAANAVTQIPALPEQVYVTVRKEHVPVVDRYWDFSRDTRPMWRLALPAAVALPPCDVPGLVRLTAADSGRLRALYHHGGPFTPDAFSPYQVDNGVFWGIEGEGDALSAAGGTHIVNWDLGVGAIGNMYTRPDSRGRGYAGAILAAIVNTLRAGGVNNIVLNVDQRNETARRIYEQYGFQIHCPYVEGIGVMRELRG